MSGRSWCSSDVTARFISVWTASIRASTRRAAGWPLATAIASAAPAASAIADAFSQPPPPPPICLCWFCRCCWAVEPRRAPTISARAEGEAGTTAPPSPPPPPLPSADEADPLLEPGPSDTLPPLIVPCKLSGSVTDDPPTDDDDLEEPTFDLADALPVRAPTDTVDVPGAVPTFGAAAALAFSTAAAASIHPPATAEEEGTAPPSFGKGPLPPRCPSCVFAWSLLFFFLTLLSVQSPPTRRNALVVLLLVVVLAVPLLLMLERRCRPCRGCPNGFVVLSGLSMRGGGGGDRDLFRVVLAPLAVALDPGACGSSAAPKIRPLTAGASEAAVAPPPRKAPPELSGVLLLSPPPSPWSAAVNELKGDDGADDDGAKGFGG